MYTQLYKLADGCLEHDSDVKSWLTNQLPFLQQANSKAFSAILFGEIQIGCMSCKFIDDLVLFILPSTRLYTFHAFLIFLTRPHCCDRDLLATFMTMVTLSGQIREPCAVLRALSVQYT
jgi:hypothetical protein